MNFTVTLDLSEEAVARAERAASRRHSTLPEVMKSYLLNVGNNEAETTATCGALPAIAALTLEEKLSAVRNSSGILQLPAGFDLKEFIAERSSGPTLVGSSLQTATAPENTGSISPMGISDGLRNNRSCSHRSSLLPPSSPMHTGFS